MPYYPEAGAMIPDPEPADLGPAMLTCTPLQRRFVIALCELGTDDHSKAAKFAGTSASDTSLHSSASQLWRNENVQKALHEELMKRMQTGKALAVATLMKLAATGSKDEIKLKASVAILNRTGMHEVSEHKVLTQDVSKTNEAMIAHIKALVAKDPNYLNMVPPEILKLLAPPKEVIDAEFTVVKDPDEELLGA